MKKLSILLLVLCLLLPTAAMATPPIVEIGGVELPNGYYMASGTTVSVAEKPAGGYAHLKDGVLTLCDYTLTSSAYSILRVQGVALEINLLGNNRLISLYGDGDGISLYYDASLTIGGSGSLHIDAPYAIYCYDYNNEVSLTGGSVTIEAHYDGIANLNGLTIGGGELTVTSLYTVAIDTTNVSITGGKLTVLSPEYVGIYAEAVNITGGTTTVTAEAWCLEAYDTLRISGADTVVDLTSTGEDAEYLALIASGKDLRIDSPLEIVEPEGGVIGAQMWFNMDTYIILDADGNPAKHVRIAAPAPVVTPTPTPAPTVPATGDHADLTLWLALSVLTMAGAVLLRKRAYR